MRGVATTYHLEIGPAIKFGFPVLLIFMFVMGASAAVDAIRREQIAGLFFVVWFGVLAAFAFKAASIPLHIDDDGDGNLIFRSALRKRKVVKSAIRSIEPLRGQIGFFRLVHDEGRIDFIGQFTGFHRLLSELAAANPALIVKGC